MTDYKFSDTAPDHLKLQDIMICYFDGLKNKIIPFDIVMGSELPIGNMLVLWAVAMSGFILAYLLFSQRDISH